MVDIYGQKLFDLISKLEDTNAICHEINLCAKKLVRVRHQVGQNKCTYGPSYWCGKYENAAGCGQGVRRFYLINFLISLYNQIYFAGSYALPTKGLESSEAIIRNKRKLVLPKLTFESYLNILT